jgi:hypothetical protein
VHFDAATSSVSRKFLDHYVAEFGQLVVIGEKHITTVLDRGRQMESIGQPIPSRRPGWDGRVCVTAADCAGPGMNRGSEVQRSQIRSVEEPEEIRQSLGFAGAKDWHRAFCAGQFAYRESMASLFERSQVI